MGHEGRVALVGPLPLSLSGDRDSVHAVLEAAKSAQDRDYWTFTRSAKGRPPSGPYYSTQAWAREALVRLTVERTVSQ